MRFVVYGAGAIGGVVGGRLAEAGHEVVLIARGDHHDAIRDDGLRIDRTPEPRPVTLSIPVVSHPAGIDFRDDDVVLLGDEEPAHRQGAAARSPPPRPRASRSVCVQNGVANEPAALRLFEDVYGVCVVCPALHLEPGVVEAHAAPVTGILDIGRFPHGVDARAEEIAAAFASRDLRVGARGPTSCGGSTGSSSTTSATRSTRCAAPTPRRDAATSGRGTEGARVPRGRGHRRSSTPEEDAARRGDGFQWGGERGTIAPGRVVVAEPGPGHRLDRGRLPQRRDRAARPAPRRADPGEPAAATARGPGRPRRAAPRQSLAVEELIQMVAVDE